MDEDHNINLSLSNLNNLSFANGCSSVWTSPVLLQFQSNDTNINPLGKPITTEQISLLVGLNSLFSILAPLFLGKLSDNIGRRKTLLCISFGLLISDLVVAIGGDILVYYIGRSISGFSSGIIFAVLPLYVNEICEDHNRAKYGCMMMLFVPLGNLYGYLVGSVTSVRLFSLLCAVPPILNLILSLPLAPETPIFLVTNGDCETAIRTLKKLRNNKSDKEIQKDYKDIFNTLDVCATDGKIRPTEIFKIHRLRKRFIIACGTSLATVMSGVFVVMSFLAPLFNNAGTNLPGNVIAIIGGSIKVFSFFVTTIIVEQVFADLSKAFDTVCHKGLSEEVKRIGVKGRLYDLIKSYLSNRKKNC
ncbi:hypothetical protein JTB14_004716 [Gonioctena quinquepunctata]|nr:hypothetical protein JTB14_004716 [Gonioctena quinquepunctata]